MTTFTLGLICGLWIFGGYLRYHDARKSQPAVIAFLDAALWPAFFACRLMGF